MPTNLNRRWLQEGAVWGNMLGKTMLPGDEELGKKDDDHKPGTTSRIPAWTYSGTLLRWRRRRIVLALVGLYLLYILAKNTPALSEWSAAREAYGYGQPLIPVSRDDHSREYDEEPTGAPPGTKPPKPGEIAPHTYEGSIKFYRLATSLHGAAHTYGYRSKNRNVLFAISSLQSASTLLPVVCDMSKWNRNYVHVAFMGREDIPLTQILEINGIDQVKCPAIWHDARPDYSEYSTDIRAESIVRAAMIHLHSFLHPQVIIIDNADSEDDFLVRGMRAKSSALHIPLLEGPANRWDSFMWMARLDSGSLSSWHLPAVELLVQVPPGSSSVIRLLQSLKSADYSGLKPPHLTIELPAEVDPSVEQYLEQLQWPPEGERNEVSIRRRIINKHASQEESAIRFLESFYPTDPMNSHVLLLSPQAELSAQYYQYLTYVLLEYKYSSYGSVDSAELMGISLELPSVLLDGVSKLSTPVPKDMETPRYVELFPATKSVPFLWQAPNSHATLFFGDKWAELHSFLSNRVAKHAQSSKATPRQKLVSETLPSWVEYMLEFMRARGYSIFYPGATTKEALVTIHNELYHAPEEYSPLPSKDKEESDPDLPKPSNEAFLRADEPAPRPKNTEPLIVPRSQPLHMLLPFDGDLPEIAHLPYLLHTGEMVAQGNVSNIASIYADKYREVIGGCKSIAGKHRVVIAGKTRDLFCFGNEDDADWESDEVDIFEVEADTEEQDLGPTSVKGKGPDALAKGEVEGPKSPEPLAAATSSTSSPTAALATKVSEA